jgi:transcriptional antiterminator RfaH
MLDQRGVEIYLPTLPSQRRATGRSAVNEPLFPGYLFVRLDLDTDDWLGVRSAPGIGYFLGCGDAPSELPDDLIEAIRLRVDRNGAVRRQLPFRRGDLVVIRQGPFEGLEAVFDGCLTARGRVRVLLEIVERLIPVTLDVRQIAKAEAKTPLLSATG